MIRLAIDENTRVLGIGVHAFDRLGLEDALPRYEIVCVDQDRGIALTSPASVKITALTDINPDIKLETMNSRGIMNSKEFRHLIRDRQKSASKIFALVYKEKKGMREAARSLGVTLLSNPYAMREQLENKVIFREIFSPVVTMPDHVIYDKQQLFENKRGYDNLSSLHLPFVIQDENLSGGKGTFIVKDKDSYEEARGMLSQKGGKRIVVSRYIQGTDVSIQGCVTRHGVFSGPLQDQIVRDPLLVNTDIPFAETFCGGRWGQTTYPPTVLQSAHDVSQTIGNTLKEKGYRGIFGIDFILGEDMILNAIEINPRLTGLTPVLAMMQQQHSGASLLLLHALEMANISYTINDPAALKDALIQSTPLSYAVLHNKRTLPMKLSASFQPGVYNEEDSAFTFSHNGYRLKDLHKPNQVLIAGAAAPGQAVKPSSRVARVVTKMPNWHASVHHIESHLQPA